MGRQEAYLLTEAGSAAVQLGGRLHGVNLENVKFFELPIVAEAVKWRPPEESTREVGHWRREKELAVVSTLETG